MCGRNKITIKSRRGIRICSTAYQPAHKKLEEELDTKLLTRTNRGVTLTDEGEALFNYAQRILLLMEEAKAEVNPNKFRTSLIIGASQTVSATKVPSLFSSF